jgi:large subunit ribosomal protein L4
LGQVRGSTRKPAPQKGRGKARVGTIRAPQHRGGYNVHGVRPFKPMTDIMRKVYEFGIRVSLSTKFMQNQVIVIDDFHNTMKLKTDMIQKLNQLNLSGKRVDNLLKY